MKWREELLRAILKSTDFLDLTVCKKITQYLQQTSEHKIKKKEQIKLTREKFIVIHLVSLA